MPASERAARAKKLLQALESAQILQQTPQKDKALGQRDTVISTDSQR
jgi:hypothetical protein